MSTEERPPAEERDGRTGGPEPGQVISNRPDVSDAGVGLDGAEDDAEDDEDDEEDTNDVNDPTAEPGKPI